ncbi:DUF362 domain-containing protein [Bacteroidota bacterium]
MFNSISGNFFVKTVLTICFVFITSLSFASNDPEETDLAVVTGENYFENTIKAVDALGGIEKIVAEGSKVGLLINSDFEHKGAYVHPDISIAVVKMSFDAGASEVICLQHVEDEYWKRSSLYEEYKDVISNVKTVKSNKFPCEFNDNDFTKIIDENAVHLKDAEVVKALFDVDVFINIPIAKHHATTHLTGALKNMMGVCTRKTNVGMHLNGPSRNDPDYLSQSIADIHLFRKADLVVADAVEFITTNGPNGPGEIKKLDKVLASTDVVAADAYCAGLLGYSVDEILVVKKAYDLGLGEMDLSKINIKEISN